MARVRGLDFAGLTYIVDAAFALAQPSVAAAFFSLVLGAGMIATGVARGPVSVLRRGFCSRGCSRRWFGVLIVAGWPANRFVILGVLLALDLAFWGAAWIGFGLCLRRY